jgi:hypothetical protein
MFLHESSERIFERPEKLVRVANNQAFATPVSPFAKVLRTVEFGNFVERTILYKCDVELRCSFYTSETISIFSGATST